MMHVALTAAHTLGGRNHNGVVRTGSLRILMVLHLVLQEPGVIVQYFRLIVAEVFYVAYFMTIFIS